MVPQRTLRHAIQCSGIGLHTGCRIRMRLVPAEADTGVVFVRTDLGVEIPARPEHVVDTRLCTTLGVNEARVATVEHLMSALAGMGVDNVRVELDGPEVPIMDGSAAPFVFLIQSAGVRELAKPKRVLRVLRRVEVADGERRCWLEPAASFRVRFHLHYEHPLLRDQVVEVDFARQSYLREVARARTFGFLHEIEALQKAGLARGGSLANAIVLDRYRIVNEGGLRYPDEFARHKILDTIGDLALVGMPILGAFVGVRTGHAMNQRLVQALLAQPEAYRIETLQAAPTETGDLAGEGAFSSAS
ncbi:MAG: UDP-3-O-acyl-N-acetylglucosamine deacetylase [Zetaproteobacteria bacterium]|nr:MAG: UDP-3-O-acyl-N-acetylglucosamine deacetylase [Zetaproteobacteria bacterium]